MFDLAAGGAGTFSRRPFGKAHISPVIAPMRYGEDAVDVTFECIRHNYFYPALANRDKPTVWEDSGAPDAWSLARAKARDILATHHPRYLVAAQDSAIRTAFRILN